MRNWVKEVAEGVFGGPVPRRVLVILQRHAKAFEVDDYKLEDDKVGRQTIRDMAMDLRAAIRTGPRPPGRAKRKGGEQARLHGLLRRDEQHRFAAEFGTALRLAMLDPRVRAFRAAYGLPLVPGKRDRLDHAREVLQFRASLPAPASEELSRLKDHLAALTLWSPGACLWFILTDVLPRESSPVQLELGAPTTLRIQPWVSAETVARVWREVQQEVLGRGSHALSQEALDRFSFADTQRMLRRSWSETHALWLKDCKRRRVRYSATPNQLLRDVRRTREALFSHRRVAARLNAQLERRDEAWRIDQQIQAGLAANTPRRRAAPRVAPPPSARGSRPRDTNSSRTRPEAAR